ncbi:MAG: recombinase family protein [Nitrospirota bacterium]
MKVAIYCRVSTESQSVDMQLSDLRTYAKQRGFEIYREYCDIGSGSKDSRPQLDALMDDARKGRVDIVLVWKFDRFARSTRHLINALHEFNHLGVDFISYTENVDTSSPTGKVLFTIISAMAEFERDLIKERVKAGLEHAKNKGIKLGRPLRMNESFIEWVRELRSEGLSIRAIAKRLNASPALVHKTLNKSQIEILNSQRLKEASG